VVAAALLFWGRQEPAELERLIKSLGSDSVEERDRAAFRLVEWGVKAFPALRKAAAHADQEVKARVNSIIAQCERIAAERERQEQEVKHDADEKARLLSNFRTESDLQKEKRTSSFFSGAARFDCSVLPFKNDLVLLTSPLNYMYIEGKWEEIPFEVVSVTDREGRSLTLDRCGICSPKRILVKDTQGPLRVHVKGTHTWYSRYSVEFQDPRDGDKKNVGDFVIQVDWPTLRVFAKKSWPKEVTAQMGTLFTYSFTENGRQCSNPPVSSILGRVQGGPLARPFSPEGW